jgi:uncharacterized protein (TIGR03437 family)
VAKELPRVWGSRVPSSLLLTLDLLERLVKSTKVSTRYYGVLLLGVLCCLDTARAQNNTLTANPTQLTFNTQAGITPASQTVLVSSANGPANITVSTYSDTSWLVVTPSSGTTALSLTVSIGAGAPTTGSDVGFINITGPGPTFLTIPVTLNINSSGASSPLSALPNSLSFNFAANSTVPATQIVTVSSNNAGVTAYTVTAITNGGGSWLTVFPGAGTLPSAFQVTVNPASLGAAGTFNGAIAINAPGTTGISVPVLVTVAGTPSLTVSPAQLSYAFQIGTSTPAAQTLTVTSSTGSNISFTAAPTTTTCGNNWLVVTPGQGATPSTLSVQINTSGLTAGTCTGSVAISAPSASNSSVTVPVNLLVSTNPLLLVPSTGPTFNYQIGGAVPAAQNVQLTSSSTALPFTVSATPVSGGPNFLAVTPTSGTTPQGLSLAINTAVLSSIGPGTYSENVTVASTGAGNSPQAFPVTLVVSSNAILTATVPSLNFNYEIGQAQPQSQTFTVGSTGGPLNYQVAANTTNCSGFLSATPANGSTYGNQNQVVVSAVTTGLTTSQSCSGNITLSVPGSTSPALVIPVTMNVSTTALLNVSQSAISNTALVGAGPTMLTVSVTSTNPNTQLPFTATAATNPIGLTWLSVAPNSGNTPNNLQITVNPANLGVGTYTATITVSSTVANVPAQTIAVTLNIVGSSATANPTSLTFSESVGGSTLAQAVQITGVPTGATIGVLATMLNGSGWLTATAAGNTVTVTANGAPLPQGSYAGVVTVIVPGAGNSPLYVPVTLTIGAAPTLSVSPTTVNLTAQIGTTVSGSQMVQVASTGVNVPFAATFAPKTGGAFITVTPASGTTPGTLTLALNAAVVSSLAAGNYSGTVTVSSSSIAGGSQNITVNLTVSPATTPAITSLTNAASLQPSNSISPGEIISIFGTNVGPATPANGTSFQLTSTGTVPTTLAGVTVTFNNVAAPLLFVSATQINAIVPYEVASFSTVNVVIQFQGTTSANFQVQVVSDIPAIFSTSENGSGQGAILNANSSVNNSANPAAKGSVVQIFGTGEGQIVPAGKTGCVTTSTPPFPTLVNQPVTVTIGGQPAPVTYSGEAPALVCGVLQVNAQVPTNIASGAQAIVLTIGTTTNASQQITVAVQ